MCFPATSKNFDWVEVEQYVEQNTIEQKSLLLRLTWMVLSIKEREIFATKLLLLLLF